MPSLDIATALSSLHTNQPPGSFSSNFILANAWDSRLLSKSFNIPTHYFNSRHVKTGHPQKLIKSVATLENNALVQNTVFKQRFCDSQQGFDLATMEMEHLSASGDLVKLEEKERLRRNRISKANKGNTPWNIGRKHSPETIQKIRERTRLAMQDPKVKLKLRSLGYAQSQETKLKIGAGVRIGLEKRRIKLKLQETCYFEWQNLIAESSRNGLLGEEELSWGSYKMLDERLSKEWLQSVQLREKTRKVTGDKRAPKSAEQKKRISLAISAKWNDPAYRNRVCSAVAMYHGIPEGSERKPKRKVNSKRPTRSLSLNPTNSASLGRENRTQSSPSVHRRRKEPLYKDPLVSCKLEMIKNIRAQRVTADVRKTKAIEQARLVIADAEKAANALEIAARTNTVAQASLVEARKLIKEAVEWLEFVNVQSLTSVAGPRKPSYNLKKLLNDAEKERGSGNQEFKRIDQPKKLKKSGAIAGGNHSDNNSGTVTFQDILVGDEKLYPYGLNKYPLPRSDIDGFRGQKGIVVPTTGAKPPPSPLDTSSKSGRSKKTWIRGKLVEEKASFTHLDLI